MSEILNDIVYYCGVVFITYIVVIIIGIIILKIKEITYDAHQNSIELSNLRRKCREVKKEIENLPVEYSTLIDGEKVLSILDKLIESEGVNE